MILVMLGTQNNSFNRLLEEIEKNIKNGTITEKVKVQAGYTKFETPNMDIFDFISNDEIDKLQNEANLIITHGGVGSIVSSIKKGKKVIAIPRLHKYAEHVNDHQKEIVKMFNQKGYIIGIDDVKELKKALQKAKDFVPNKYENNNEKMLETISEFIDKI